MAPSCPVRRTPCGVHRPAYRRSPSTRQVTWLTSERRRTMRIGILGTGRMATALGGAWVRAGHDVLVGGRDRAAAARTAARIGAVTDGTLADAAVHGELVLAAVPADAAPRLANGLAAVLTGRTVVDCSNPVEPGDDGLTLSTGGTTSVARLMREAAPGAHVVKAFNLCHDSIWTLPRPVFEGVPLAVPFCGDDPGSLDRTATLIRSMGCTPIRCGGLSRAVHIEAAAAFAIGVWRSGDEPRHVFPAPAEVEAS
nr:NAD(P)-binding domain-containing protein [Microbispora sp. H10885]